MLKSRTSWPPGGWLFLEPATGWRAPKGLTFGQVVSAIIQHRKQNRQHKLTTDPDQVADQLDAYTCARLRFDPAFCVADPGPARNFTVPLPSPGQPVRAGKGSVAAVARFLSNTTAGIKLWIDWFGDGKPVEKARAEARAAICVDCPQNDKASNVLDWFTGIAAREIMAIFSALNDLNLHTSKDPDLKVCKACDCPLRAKVWPPLAIIKKHLSKERFDKLDRACWIRHEPSE
jgi:hypothetical protein